MISSLSGVAAELRKMAGRTHELAVALEAIDATHVLVSTTPGHIQPTPPPVEFIPPMLMRMSPAGREFLAELEGVELQPYRDVAGIWTIGVGHVIRDGEDHLRAGITRDQAMALLDEDVRWAEDAVHGLDLSRPLAQHELDALVCFCFNVGARAFKGSTMARKLQAGDYGCVPSELMRWVYYTDATTGQKKVSSGLQNRRRQTGELWTRGDYTVTW